MKRIIALILTLCTLLSAMPSVMLTAHGTGSGGDWDVDGDGTLSILAIGDEFSEDIMTYVRDIAHNLGISRIFLGNLSTEDGTLADLWAYAQEDNAAYTYFTNADGQWLSTEEYKLSTALTSRSWDFVTLQQAGDLSGREETYGSHLTNLVNYVKALAPGAKLAWNMTWAYQEGSHRLRYSSYADQTDMHHSIVSAVMNEIVPTGAFAKIVPIGTAATNSRTSLLGDILCDEEGYRLSEGFGRYLAAMTFVHAITGLDIFKTDWAPEGVPFAWQVIAAESAANAVSEPFSIIYSMHDDVKTSPLYEDFSTRSAASPAGDSAYARNYPQWTKGGYYNNQQSQSPIKTETNSKYFWCTLRYSKTHLPVGSVIHLGSGYKFRMEAFLSSGTTSRGKEYYYGKTNSDSAWTGKYLTITDSHWNGKHLLAFNVSSSKDEVDITGTARSTMDNNFKIYYCVGSGNLESFSKYVRLKYTYEKQKYWYCTDKDYWKDGCTTSQESNAKSFLRTPKYTESDLPAGTIIYVSSDWKWRSDCWTNLNARYTGTRPPESNEVYTRLSDAFWRDQPYRAFNISTNGEANLANYSDSTIRENFRIYVPISVHNSKHKTTTSTTDSTCTKTGVKKITCPSCNYYQEDTIAKKSHNSNTTIPAVAPTCTTTGLTEGKKCSVCGTVTVPQQVVPMLPHPYVYAATTEPTLTSTGVLTGICSVCGGTTTVTLPVLNTTDYSYTVLDGGTCVATGIERYTWKNTEYGTFYFDVVTEATPNHSYDTGTVTTPPTCSTTGVRTYTCTLCGSTKMEPIAVDPNAHNWDSGKVTLLPTSTQTGEKTYICTHDNAHTKVETIPVDTTVYVTTHMGQYAQTLGGGTQIREDGKGAELADNADLNVGDVAVYSFDILNKHEVPVYNISFEDDVLGVSVSPHEITLNQPLSQQPLAVYYYPVDGEGNLSTALPEQVGSVADMQDLIRQANASGTAVGGTLTRNYVVQITSEQELRELLALGVPRSCKISLYGFKHIVGEEDAPFSNTLNSRSYFNRNLNSRPGSPTEEATLLTGSQTRTLSALRYPTAEALRVVMDYGKPVCISHEELISRISDNGSCVVGELVGLTMEGNDTEQLLTDAPETMKDFDAGMGVFTVTEDGITYEPKHFLSEVEKVYALYRLEDCYGLNAAGERVELNYISVKIEAIPANRLYYEAEDFTNEISYVKKATDKNTTAVTTTETWTVEGTSLQGSQHLDPVGDQNIVIPDYSRATNVLFFGFDDTDADAERYKLSQYNGTNFDRSKWNGGSNKFVQGTNTTIEDGALKIVPYTGITQDVYTGTVNDQEKPGAGAVALHPDCSNNGNSFTNANEKALSYDPSEAEVFQIRFKMKNLDTKVNEYGNITKPYIGLHIWCEGKNTPGESYKNDDGNADAARCITNYTYDASVLNSDEYVVWTFPLGNQFSEIGTVWGLRAYFGNTFGSRTAGVEGYLMVDYIYMGPVDMAPYRETYGYDHSYENAEILSNGASLYTEGNGVATPAVPDPANYTCAQFSFTGTGFDIISRTGPDQGTIRVEIFDKVECTQDDLITFTTVNLKGEKDKYQIPVYSKEGLDYGTYWVKIGVNDKVNYPAIPQLSRGNQFYFDGLIIYDSLEETEDVLDAYEEDGEAYPYVSEVRDILLDAEKFKELSDLDYGSIGGAVYLDYESVPKVTVPALDEDGNPTNATENVTDPGVTGITNHLTTNILTYEKVGPKNEVYLSPLQAIAFKLAIYSQELPERIDVGCKSIMDPGGILCIETAKGERQSTGIFCRPLDSSTVQYFSLPLNENVFTEEEIDGKPCYTTYIVIRNTAKKNDGTKNAILSITDIKIAYTQEPTPKTETPDSGSTSSGTELQSVENGALKRNGDGDAELPADEFVPVGFVVDSHMETVIRSMLYEYDYNEETELEKDDFETDREELTFAGASVSLQSDLAIHYKVNERYFTELGYTDPYVVIVDNGIETVIREYTVADGKLSFVYKNIAPHRIGDTITATLYGSYNGTVYASESRDYSVADYCCNMLNRYGENPAYAKLRTLLVDILLYGAESQKYTNYHADRMCTDGLTEEQLSWGTELTRELVNLRDQNYETIENPTVQWKGAGLNLQESVAVRFKILAESYEGLEVRITLAGVTVTAGEGDFEYRADGTYVHFTKLNAAQMSEPIYVAVFRDGVQVSNTVRYSIESYAYAKQKDTTVPYLASLVERMMCYGDSARAYIGK